MANDDTVRKNRKPNCKELYVRSREKTPNWLNKSRNMREIQSEEYVQDLEYNRKGFLKQLEKD